MSGPAVVGVVGRSGSGKTSLLELLVPQLNAQGLAVGTVKHTSHGFLADRPGKDSYRLYEAGAASVALISRQQLATFTRRSDDAGPDVSLDTALASLPGDLDVVLVEGFSWEPIPRFVVVPDSESAIPEHLSRGEVLGILRVPAKPDRSKPSFPQTLVESVAGEIELRVRQGSANLPVGAGDDETEADLSTGGDPVRTARR
jgi:molybdopterin-guanine dinucleotide biosynthesis protein MobB